MSSKSLTLLSLNMLHIHYSIIQQFNNCLFAWTIFFFFFSSNLLVTFHRSESFLGPHPGHMEFPRVGVKWELQLPAYTRATATVDPSCICDIHHSSGQRWISDPLSEARDRTCILMDTLKFISAVQQWELLKL